MTLLLRKVTHSTKYLALAQSVRGGTRSVTIDALKEFSPPISLFQWDNSEASLTVLAAAFQLERPASKIDDASFLVIDPVQLRRHGSIKGSVGEMYMPQVRQLHVDFIPATLGQLGSAVKLMCSESTELKTVAKEQIAVQLVDWFQSGEVALCDGLKRGAKYGERILGQLDLLYSPVAQLRLGPSQLNRPSSSSETSL